MSERFLIRTDDGPHPGNRVTDGWAWPLPDSLPDEGGRYVKKTESILPPMPEDGHVLRGAAYEWEPDEQEA